MRNKRKCLICDKYKYAHEFAKGKKGKIKNRCKVCHAEQTRADRYGLSVSQLRDFLAQFDNKCEICGADGSTIKRGLCIDHDHQNETNRGLLCPNCNYILGHAQDNVKILERCIEYIRHYKRRDAQFAIGGLIMENVESQEDRTIGLDDLTSVDLPAITSGC